jgi:hypothetical protein
MQSAKCVRIEKLVDLVEISLDSGLAVMFRTPPGDRHLGLEASAVDSSSASNWRRPDDE